MATLTKGQTFLANDIVTAAKLHALIDNATLSDVVNADIDDSAAIVDTKLATISTAGKVSATALVDLASTPAGAGVIPAANLALPVKATGAEIDTGTDDAKFATPKAIADSGLANETAWTDYSATSTIVGWASFTGKIIYTKKIGKTVFVQYYIAGTSNAATASFTVPYATGSAYSPLGFSQSVEGSTVLIGLSIMAASGKVISITKAAAGTDNNWATSGSKGVYGQFFYEAA